MLIGRSKKKKIRLEFENACVDHMDGLFAAALKMTRNSVDAEELVQDTFVRAFRFGDSFEWGTNLKAWLFRILTNTFINNYRHKKHELRYVERAAAEPIYDQVLDRQAKEYAANPEAHLFSSFFKKDLDSALEDLPEDFRVVVVLSDMQGFTYKEIAKMIESPIGTVMSRLHRGRRILQQKLVDHAIAAGIVDPLSQSEEKASNLVDFKKNRKSAS